MNRIISDTAEYGCYLFDHAAKPILAEFMKDIKSDVIGNGNNIFFSCNSNRFNNEVIGKGCVKFEI